MFILNDMHEADVVEVKDVVVDDVDEEGGVEGEAGDKLLQELGVSPKSPVPDRGEDFFIGEDDKETERNGQWHDISVGEKEQSGKVANRQDFCANFANWCLARSTRLSFTCNLFVVCHSDQRSKLVLMYFLFWGFCLWYT